MSYQFTKGRGTADNPYLVETAAGVSGVFGVFQKFPKFLGGRIVLTAAEEPTIDGTTIVQVQEV